MIDISHLNKADVLAALYNYAKPQGLGYSHYISEDMTAAQAAQLLEKDTHFDYVQGRVLKVEINGTALDPRLYDRDNGEGAAQRAIDSISASTL